MKKALSVFVSTLLLINISAAAFFFGKARQESQDKGSSMASLSRRDLTEYAALFIGNSADEQISQSFESVDHSVMLLRTGGTQSVEEEKTVEKAYLSPVVSGVASDGDICITWLPISDERLTGYAISASEKAEDATSTVISISDLKCVQYDGFEDKGLIPGKEYIFSVTAVYGDIQVSGNPVILTYPVTETPKVFVLDAAVENNVIKLSWTAESTENFQGYKVVISEQDSTPSYPDNGYLYWITESSQTNCMVDNKTAYNGGDIDSYLVPGKAYYFAITYVYMDKKITTPAVKVTAPESIAIKEVIPPVSEKKLEAWVKDGAIKLMWTAESAENFQGYKVVISEKDSTPSYPDNGYLYWITDHSKTYCLVDNSSAYNGGDICSYLVPGKTYYFAITYVYKDKKITTPAVKVTAPESMVCKEVIKPATEKKLEAWVKDSVVKLSWTAESAENFQGYKVVISEKDSTPSYPDNGYLYWITDRTKTYCLVDNKTAYNGGDINSYLVPGKTYYFAITYVYKDKKITTPAVKVTAPESMTNMSVSEPVTEKSLEVWARDNVIKLMWTAESAESFQGYKVVISEQDSTPAYPDNGYLYWITDRSQTYCLVDNSCAYNGGDIGSYLVPGKTYYFAITYVYTDKKITAAPVAFTAPENMPVP